MKWLIKTSELDENNKSLVALLQLLCNIEFATATMRWYVGEVENLPQLPEHEQVLALALNIANVGEALHLFNRLVERKVIERNEKWSQRTSDAWEFLHSDVVIALKANHLKLIRDKSAFHVDPQPVLMFIEKIKSQQDAIPIWEVDTTPAGHSPMAAMIIAEHLLHVTVNNKEIAGLSSNVFGALRDVIIALISDIINISTQES